jgi:hypothetical protein
MARHRFNKFNNMDIKRKEQLRKLVGDISTPKNKEALKIMNNNVALVKALKVPGQFIEIDGNKEQ